MLFASRTARLCLFLKSYIIPSFCTPSSLLDDTLAFTRAWAFGLKTDSLAHGWEAGSMFPYSVGYPRLGDSKNSLKDISFFITKVDEAINVCARKKRRSREVTCIGVFDAGGCTGLDAVWRANDMGLTALITSNISIPSTTHVTHTELSSLSDALVLWLYPGCV